MGFPSFFVAKVAFHALSLKHCGVNTVAKNYLLNCDQVHDEIRCSNVHNPLLLFRSLHILPPIPKEVDSDNDSK